MSHPTHPVYSGDVYLATFGGRRCKRVATSSTSVFFDAGVHVGWTLANSTWPSRTVAEPRYVSAWLVRPPRAGTRMRWMNFTQRLSGYTGAHGSPRRPNKHQSPATAQ